MDQYFSLVSKEFELRTKQIRQFIKKHNPSIGAFNEEILRGFLRDFLPKWVSVSQGFVLDKNGEISNQIDILIYNSTLYAPLYSVGDLVVLPAESVIIAIEVKTKINKKIFQDILPKNKKLKSINSEIESQIFIYNPPSANKTIDYLNQFDFFGYKEEELPDKIYGLSKFCISKSNIKTEKSEGVGYMVENYKSKTTSQDAIFEAFYYNVYRVVEMKINQALKNGINNVFIINGDDVEIKGRLGYSNTKVEMDFGNILIEKTIANTVYN
jgi:hypothetical protein